MSGDIQMKRLRRESEAELKVLSQIVTPEVLHRAVPRLAEVREARVERQNMLRSMNAFKDFAPGTHFHYVAQIDQAVWSVILELFAKFDPETGLPMHDGLLYKEDARGNVVINRPFFYMLVDALKAAGYDVDMRAKKKLTI